MFLFGGRKFIFKNGSLLKFKCRDKVWIFGDFLQWGEKEAKIKIWIENQQQIIMAG